MRNLPIAEIDVAARSAWTWLVDGLSLLALSVLLTWWLVVGDSLAPIQQLVVLLIALPATAAAWTVRRGAACRLRWDGRQWINTPAGATGDLAAMPGQLKVMIDLQFAMLLRFETGEESAVHVVRWIGVDCRMPAAQWHLLRCAAHFSAPGSSQGVGSQRLRANE